MKQSIKAYIDNYDEITVIIEKKGRYKGKKFYLYETEDLVEELSINYQATENNIIKIGLKVKSRLNFHYGYLILDDANNTIPVYTGSVVRTSQFESEYYYDGPLGFEYTENSTIFRVWSPVAKSIFLEVVYPDGHNDKREMNCERHGVWTTEVSGDLDKVAYRYQVKIFDEYQPVVDPYALSSSANGEYSYVIDINKLYKMKYDKPKFSGYYSDAVIYEASIRDLTVSLDSDLRGTFLGLVDETEDKGLNYVSSLGVTHLQLMPVYDFGGVDDIKKDEQYNWGYNPEQYFVPCGWYSKDPNDPYSRLNEYLELIDEAHKKGLRVIMDVVFNHVYEMKEFPFETLVPGYFYRVDLYGNYTNTSGCGNDLATEKRMTSRFIIDNLTYWAKIFNISGFRFDLMGLLDIETLNNAYTKIKQIDNSIMVYGEGWNMPNTIPDAFRPHSYNHFKMPNYGFFNDKYRDSLKGNQWENNRGLAFGGDIKNLDLLYLVTGSCLDYFKFQNPNQTVNYVECHDNYTMYDYATYKLKLSEKEAITGCKLALQIIAISMGIVFIHAGQEFYRTKQGVENSYNSSDKINIFDYNRRDLFKSDIEGLKDLLQIRKKYPEFRMINASDIEKVFKVVDKYCTPNSVGYTLTGSDYILTIIIKNGNDLLDIAMNNCQMIFNGIKADNYSSNNYQLANPGVYIFKENL